MTLTKALTAAAKERKLTAAQQRKLDRVLKALKRKGRLARLIQEHVAHKIEAETGKKLGPVDAIDWQKWIELLIQYLPSILQLLISILALFGL